MGQTLENSIYLPDEGETNCYSGLASNWRALDTLKGSYSAHAINVEIHVTAAEKETWNGKADASALTAHTGDTTIHVTAEDKAKWDAVTGKADASALTAHTGDTTIHVTAEDKQAWNNHVADTVKHVTAEDKAKWDAVTGKADASALTAHTGDTTIHVTAEDKQAWNNHVADTVKHVTAEDKAKWDAVTSKADDSDVVHKSGNETVGGQKTLVNLLPLKGEFLGTESSNNARSLLYFLANRDTQNQSGIFLTKFRQNKAQGSMSGNDVAYLSFDCLENSVRTNNGLRINFQNFVDGIPQRFILWSGITEKLLGTASASWSDVSTDKINSLNPSSLGMPDLDNGIDISSYITVVANANKESLYTPTVNGWISVALTRAGGGAHAVLLKQGNFASSGHNIAQENGTTTCNAMLPVKGGVQVSINSALANGIAFAYFYPCLGNV